VAETRSLRRSPPRWCTSMHLASPSLQAWVYQAYAGPLTSTGTQALAPIMLPGGTVKAGRGRGRRRSCWALNREHRLVASTVLSVADARRRHGDLDGDVDIAAALREPTGSCAPRSPTTCCMPLECSPATNTPGHGDRRYAAGLSASRPGWPEHNADRSCTCPITGPGRNNGLHSGAT
jgi:hypothetical protein